MLFLTPRIGENGLKLVLSVTLRPLLSPPLELLRVRVGVFGAPMENPRSLAATVGFIGVLT